jgi:hypothetical protein
MPCRKHHHAKTLMVKVNELAWAAPQVVAHRVARMAAAQPVLSAWDRKEFTTMWLEKPSAFAQSWFAMCSQALQAQQSLAMSLTSMSRAFWLPTPMRAHAPRRLARQFGNASLGIAAKGVAPVHRKAVANARRLAKTKLR